MNFNNNLSLPNGTYIPLSQRERVSRMTSKLLEGCRDYILDDNLEGGYLHIFFVREVVAYQRLYALTHSIPEADLVVDVIVKEIENGPDLALFIHKIDVLPDYTFFWPELLDYLTEYARKRGCIRIIATGKSTVSPRQMVLDQLRRGGFVPQSDFYLVKELAECGGC